MLWGKEYLAVHSYISIRQHQSLVFGILCWNEAVQLQRTDHSPGKVLCWTFTCHSKMSVLAILWKMYPLCSHGLLQAVCLFQGLKMSQLWEAASTVLVEKHKISALIGMECWSTGPGTGSHLGEEKGKAILCQVIGNSWWDTVISQSSSPRQEEGLLPSHLQQGRNPEGQQKETWQRQDISVTGENEPRCSKFPSADSVTRLSTQIKRIDVRKR